MSTNQILQVGDNVIVAGWGRTEEVPAIIRPEFLQALKVHVIDWHECKMVWHGRLKAHHICAGTQFKNAGACNVRIFVLKKPSITKALSKYYNKFVESH